MSTINNTDSNQTNNPINRKRLKQETVNAYYPHAVLKSDKKSSDAAPAAPAAPAASASSAESIDSIASVALMLSDPIVSSAIDSTASSAIESSVVLSDSGASKVEEEPTVEEDPAVEEEPAVDEEKQQLMSKLAQLSHLVLSLQQQIQETNQLPTMMPPMMPHPMMHHPMMHHPMMHHPAFGYSYNPMMHDGAQVHALCDVRAARIAQFEKDQLAMTRRIEQDLERKYLYDQQELAFLRKQAHDKQYAQQSDQQSDQQFDQLANAAQIAAKAAHTANTAKWAAWNARTPSMSASRDVWAAHIDNAPANIPEHAANVAHAANIARAAQQAVQSRAAQQTVQSRATQSANAAQPVRTAQHQPAHAAQNTHAAQSAQPARAARAAQQAAQLAVQNASRTGQPHAAQPNRTQSKKATGSIDHAPCDMHLEDTCKFREKCTRNMCAFNHKDMGLASPVIPEGASISPALCADDRIIIQDDGTKQFKRCTNIKCTQNHMKGRVKYMFKMTNGFTTQGNSAST